MTAKRLTFWNHFGIGDLWESREFVRAWMRIAGVSECEYACRYPAVFEDMPEIKCIAITDDLKMHSPLRWRGRHLFVNTWIGALNGETNPKGDYVIWPGVGCTVENLYRMHNTYLRMAGFRQFQMRDGIANYISEVDYSKIDLGGVEDFAREYSPQRKILVCNGDTSSQHAANFNMAKMVDLIPPEEGIIILTERAEVKRPNVFFTDDITRRNGRCDVLAISRLSNFCNFIVGRCSGAQMTCETRRNWMDPTKTLVSFTQHRNGASFVLNPKALGLQMELHHSTASTPEDAAQFLHGILRQ